MLKSRYEKDDVLRLARALKPLLEAQGLGVVLTRDSDAALPIAERCRIANEAGCAYFLSLHRDAAGPAARGVGLWVHSGADWPTVQKAQDILTELLAVTPVRDRGVRKGTPQNYRDFGVNTGTVMASALLELGFLTNEEDNTLFDRYLPQYAEAAARGLCRVVGIAYRAPSAGDVPRDPARETVRAALDELPRRSKTRAADWGCEMDCSKNQPCESLRALEQKVDGKFREYDERLGDGEVSFAVIKTKLNLILGILAAIGGCLVPVLLNLIFS